MADRPSGGPCSRARIVEAGDLFQIVNGGVLVPTSGVVQSAAVLPLVMIAPELLAALKEYVEWYGAVHGQDCPADDTCDCIGRGINARVSAAIARAEGKE